MIAHRAGPQPMTRNEAALTQALGKARAQITALRMELQRDRTPLATLDRAAHMAEAQTWLERIGIDPDAATHRAQLIDAIYSGETA